jgi:hypothetical protein
VRTHPRVKDIHQIKHRLLQQQYERQKCNIRSAATSFDKTIFRELGTERIDCSLAGSGYLLGVAANDQNPGLIITRRKEMTSTSGRSAQSRRGLAAKRPAVFSALTTNRFQFLRRKGWKILLFERLALFL